MKKRWGSRYQTLLYQSQQSEWVVIPCQKEVEVFKHMSLVPHTEKVGVDQLQLVLQACNVIALLVGEGTDPKLSLCRRAEMS